MNPGRTASRLWRAISPAAAATLALWAHTASANDVPADPSNYRTLLATLKPGDTLQLAGGKYGSGLSISGMNGLAGKPITIAGPASGTPATFLGNASFNTVELENSSFITIQNLVLDGQDIPDEDAIKAGGAPTSWTHDITIEGCTILRHDGGGQSQQTDGISTKIVSWNWVIRNNVINGAGTGMYLGNSDGSAAFFGGVIENNFYESTLGYNMEIKFQVDRGQSAGVPGVPSGPATTIIRNNVFVKHDLPACPSDTPTGCGRPNLLVDGFPDTGPGSSDHYEVYGNLFVHDSDDFLFQASGRVHVHDNIFVDDPKYGGMHFADHDGKTVIDAIAYNNTLYSVGAGIQIDTAPTGVGFVVGNAVFSPKPIQGTAKTLLDNVTDSVANAGRYVSAPGITFGTMDFYPKKGSALHGPKMDLSSVATDADYDKDFNGEKKDFTYRGAYTGDGSNPGWKLEDAPKCVGGASDGGAPEAGLPDAGAGDSSHAHGEDAGLRSDAGAGADGAVGGAPGGSSGGCSCETARATGGGGGGAALVAAAAVVTASSARRRRRRERARRSPSL